MDMEIGDNDLGNPFGIFKEFKELHRRAEDNRYSKNTYGFNRGILDDNQLKQKISEYYEKINIITKNCNKSELKDYLQQDNQNEDQIDFNSFMTVYIMTQLWNKIRQISLLFDPTDELHSVKYESVRGTYGPDKVYTTIVFGIKEQFGYKSDIHIGKISNKIRDNHSGVIHNYSNGYCCGEICSIGAARSKKDEYAAQGIDRNNKSCNEYLSSDNKGAKMLLDVYIACLQDICSNDDAIFDSLNTIKKK
jgi:hypothetical protein